MKMPRKRKEPLSGSDEENEQGGPRKHSKNAHPFQRHAANERERSRMRVLSKAFSKLKTTLPWVPSDTKLSKLDTLRLASSYIAHLKQILDSEEEEVTSNNPSTIHPLNLVCSNLKLNISQLEICFSQNISHITKIHLYNFDPLKPHFYIVILGFTGVYTIFLFIFFLFFLLKHIDCGYSLEPL